MVEPAPRIAVIVLNYNTSALTGALAAYLVRDLDYPSKTLYVIDNGSGERCPSATHRLPCNLGFTRGMHEGWRIASAEGAYDAFWLLNSDVGFEYGHDVLSELAAILFRSDEHAQIAPQMNSPHAFMERARGEAERVAYLEPTATLVKSSTFERIGFWDLDLELGWGVDYDFGYRVRQAGLSNILTNRARITHKEHKSIADWQGYVERAASQMHTVLGNKYGPGWERINRMQRVVPVILTCCRDLEVTARFVESYRTVRHVLEAPRVIVDLSSGTRLPARYLELLGTLDPAWLEFHPPEPGMSVYDSVQEAATTALAKAVEDAEPDDLILFLEDDIVFSPRFAGFLPQATLDSNVGFLSLYLPGTGYGTEQIPADEFYGTQCVLFPRRAAEEIVVNREEMQRTIPPGYDIRWSRFLASRGYKLYSADVSYVQHIGGKSRLHAGVSHASELFAD